MAKQEVKSGRCGMVSEILNGPKLPGVFDFLEGQDYLERHPELGKVQNFFNTLSNELNPGENGVFSDPELQLDFKKRLGEFIVYVDEEIIELSKGLRGSEDYNNFSQDWERHVRMACYYSFFVHYGAKRRGEADRQGNPRDYVYHVTRSGFNCLMRKMRFFDEQSLMAAFLHDTREDYEKGFCRLILTEPGTRMADLISNNGKRTQVAKDSEGRAAQKEEVIFEKFKGFEEYLDDLNEKVDTGEVSLSDLLDILTKSSDNRMRALLEMILKICQTKPLKRRFSAIKALMVKMADRLDNIKSFTSGSADREDKVHEIEDETTFIFMLLCSSEFLNMPNVHDFFMDYIWFKDNPVERVAHTRRDRHYKKDLGKPEHLLREEMKEDFRSRLSERLGRLVNEGNDYILQFRDRGHRYEDKSVVEMETKSGQYSKAFRGYIIFHPVRADGQMVEFGREIFREIFNGQMPSRESDRREIVNARLGRVIVSNGAAGYDNKKYGAGVWSAFDSQEKAMAALIGNFPVAYLFDNLDLQDRIVSFFDEIAPRVRFLVEQYQVLDGLEDDTGAVERQQLVIGNKAQRAAGLRMRRQQPFEKFIDPKKFFKGSTKEEIITRLKKLLSDLAKTLFLQPVRLVEVHINHEKRDTVLPAGIAGNELGPLLFAAPLILGRDVKAGKAQMSLGKLIQSVWQEVLEKVFSSGTSTEIEVYARLYTVGFSSSFYSQRAQTQVDALTVFLAQKRAEILREEGIAYRRFRASSRGGGRRGRRR